MIGGRFTLLAPLGRGAMGTVHEAYDEHLHRRVALKQLLLSDEEVMRRFRREARLTARLHHPGVPAVYDLGDAYIALEYVDGQLLTDLIAEAAPLPDAWVATIGLQIVAVLMAAHAHSLVHRDLKPSNVLLTSSGAIKVIDFGVATLVGDESLSTLTPPGVAVGTASYQAPECQLGLAGPRSDLYSLGRVLGDLGGPSWSALVAALTAADPGDRPASAAELVALLRPMVGPLQPLRGFVADPRLAAELTEAYLTLAITPPAGRVVAPKAPRNARAEAERLATADRHEEAVAVLDAAIAAAAGDPLELELRRDLVRYLFQQGCFARTVDECASLIPQLAARLGESHAAVLQACHWQAAALAHLGDTPSAMAAFNSLAQHGQATHDAEPIRRSVAQLTNHRGAQGKGR